MTSPHSPAWRDAVRTMLGKGLGAEDVAVAFTGGGVPTAAAEVRAEIAALRAKGDLAEIYGRQG